MARAMPRKWPRLVFSPVTRPQDGVPVLATKLAFLNENRVFAGLPDAERHWLAHSTTMVFHERGHVFYAAGEKGEVIFILKRGRANLYRLAPDGRKLVTAQLQPGTVFGEMAIFGQGMYGCHAEAATDCLICVLSKRELTGLIERNPVVALNLLHELGSRLQACETAYEGCAFGSVPSRLAAFLLDEVDTFGTVLGMTHQEIGERLGIYRETVSQTLGRFRHDGIITVETRRIRLLNPDRLAAIAHG